MKPVRWVRVPQITPRPLTQVVREAAANRSIVGSIPTEASILVWCNAARDPVEGSRTGSIPARGTSLGVVKATETRTVRVRGSDPANYVRLAQWLAHLLDMQKVRSSSLRSDTMPA